MINKNQKRIIMFIVTIILTITIIETSYYILNKQKISSTTQTFYTSKPQILDPQIGYKQGYNSVINSVKNFRNGSVLYNISQTLDEFSRRRNKHNNGSPLLLFGGSYMFGSELKDNETLSHYLSNITKFDVYNYGLPGYGANNMLAILEQKNFTKEVNKTGGKAIYLFTNLEVKRVIGEAKLLYGRNINSPYYYLDKNDEVQRKGSFKAGRPITTAIYKLLGRSNVIKYYNIDIPIHRKKHTYLTYKIIEKSKEIYEEKFNGTFYVLIHPFHNNKKETKELKQLLINNNINILEYNITNKTNIEGFRIPYDGHPNAKLNKELAEQIAMSIRSTNLN